MRSEGRSARWRCPFILHPSSFILAVAALLAAATTSAAELRGSVVGIADGDTITVLDGTHRPRKVRLAGIDAPEMRQPYGALAKRNLAALVLGKPVVVAWHKRDRYGRIVGHVLLAADGDCGRQDCARLADAGLAQIESGLAWHYKQFQAEQTPEDRGRYARAELEARTRREGLWKDADPIPPWEYRHPRSRAG